MKKSDGLIPRLRFPEFRDAGPWKMQSIENLAAKIAQGGTPSTPVPEYWNGNIPWITPAEMGKGAAHHYAKTTLRSISTAGVENSSTELLPVNSVIISSRAPIGYVAINKVEMATNQGCKGIIPKEGVYHEFLYFNLLRADQRLNDIGAGAGFKEISTSTLRAFQLPTPSLNEQQKIADCLSSLDDLIRAEEAALVALKDHKRGVMQQLFPIPSQTTPRLRFPEFRDAGPWGVKRLGDKGIAEFIRDRVEAKDIPRGHYISTASLLPDFEGLASDPQSPPSGTVISYHEGDILMSNIRPYLRKVWISDRSGGASNDVLIARPGKSVVRTFLGHLLMSDRFISHVMIGAKGVKMPRGDLEQIQRFAVPLPSKSEQQKIADCLTSLDDLIRSKSELVDALTDHKRGLMQQLFPQDVG